MTISSVSISNARRMIMAKDIEFTQNWIRENLETIQDGKLLFSETYQEYCSVCLLKNITAVAKNSFGPLIRKEFPDSFAKPLTQDGKTMHFYFNVARRKRPLSSSATPLSAFFTMVSLTSSAESKEDSLLSPVRSGDSHHHNDRGDDNYSNNKISLGIRQQQALKPFPSSSLPAKLLSMFPGRNINNQTDLPRGTATSYTRGTSTPAPVTAQGSNGPFQGQRPLVPFSDTNPRSYTTDTRHSPSTFTPQPNPMTEFLRFYEEHCNEVLELIQAGQLEHIEECVVRFYQQRLPERFPNLIREHLQEAIESICRCDTTLYETINVSMLSIMSRVPENKELLTAVEEYTRQLENYLGRGLDGYPIELLRKKVHVARAFVCASWRHTRLVRMAELTAIYTYRPEVLKDMRRNWEGVDIAFIIDHASRLPREECCVADGNEIKRILIADVGNLLCGTVDIDTWIRQMDSVIENYLNSLLPSARDARNFRFSVEQFMMNWTFYTSLVLEELTLAKVENLGNFNVLVLFLNELIQFCVDASLGKILRTFR